MTEAKPVSSLSHRNLIMNAVKVLCVAAAVAMIAISITVYGASATGLLIMLLFTIIYIQLPGMLIAKAAGLDRTHMSTTLAAGLFAGWSMELIIYFIADMMHSNILLYVIGPVMSAVYLWMIIKDRTADPFRGFRFSRLSMALCIFMAVTLLYCLLDTQYQHLAPAISEYTYMNPDKAYHLGLVVSLAHDYPLQSPWISGRFINYHIFGEMLFSIPVRLFGLEADFVVLSFGPLMTAYSVGVSLYSFFREMMDRKERAGIYCLVLILSNIYITRNIRSSIAFKFILENDNSAGYGIAATLVTIVLFRKWYESFLDNNRDQWLQGFLCILFIMLTTGIKGPMGAVMIGGLWGTFMLGIILRKMPLRSFLPLVFFTAGFLLIYLTVLGSKGQTNGGGNSIIAFATISNIAFWKEPLIAALKAVGIPYSLRLLAVLAVFVLFFLTVYFVPFCIGYVRELFLVLSGRKQYEPARVLVYAECAVGFIAMLILNYSGHSQIYFGLVTVFLAPAVAYWFIEDMEERKKVSRGAGAVLGITVACMAVCLVITTATLGQFLIKHCQSAVEATDPSQEHNLYLSISNKEYEAMTWIDANTEEDALLATDRYYSVSLDEYSVADRWDNRFFLYPVYANRFCYIAGSGYNLPAKEWHVRKEMIETNAELYDPDNEDRGDLARELDVDYIVVSKRFTDAADLTNEDYSRCFSNDDVDIYKVAE